ncbi:hypothetical protein KY289_018898 [Solanum tuberosum]|nr:hypothetical protein KY284_016685 [Solanum tuberosum]KAH0691540.1 hypothetical protein KY289_018898 [Solanum tuberosum]
MYLPRAGQKHQKIEIPNRTKLFRSRTILKFYHYARRTVPLPSFEFPHLSHFSATGINQQQPPVPSTSIPHSSQAVTSPSRPAGRRQQGPQQPTSLSSSRRPAGDNHQLSVLELSKKLDMWGTNMMEGSRYVTCNVHFEDICELDAYLKVCMTSDDVYLSKMASGMKEKFKKYWGTPEKMNKMHFIAFVLDPRNKFMYVSFALEELLGEEKGKIVNNEVNAYLKNLFAIYFYMKKQKEDSGSLGVKSELDRYLLEDQEPEFEDFDILIWWKVNSPKFPILSQLARDVLTIPMSSVASECAFSTSGRILDPFRSSLTSKCVQCLICVQDWLRQETKPICVKKVWSFLKKLNLRWQIVEETLPLLIYDWLASLKSKSQEYEERCKVPSFVSVLVILLALET